MTLLPQFDPPAFLDDFTAPQKDAWSQFISDDIDQEIATWPGNRFYNPTKTDTTPDAQTAVIRWTGFPRNVLISSPNDRARWTMADSSRDLQDEYCEWSVQRNAAGKILSVTFTCEGPEYWRFLAQVNPQLVVQLYQQHISQQVVASDLFTSTGQYRPRNKWNNSTTTGAMHLIQGANTLLAEINIAVRSTIVRRINGALLTDAQDLINCGRYGDPDRFSDPTIGASVNELARQDAAVTIANPVALYIDDLDTNGWAAPGGTDPKSLWKITRGTASHAVRAVYAAPAGAGFTVSDITINGIPIEFGAQIADRITIKVVGQACNFGQVTTPPQTQCQGFNLTARSAGVLDALQQSGKHR